MTSRWVSNYLAFRFDLLRKPDRLQLTQHRHTEKGPAQQTAHGGKKALAGLNTSAVCRPMKAVRGQKCIEGGADENSILLGKVEPSRLTHFSWNCKYRLFIPVSPKEVKKESSRPILTFLETLWAR